MKADTSKSIRVAAAQNEPVWGDLEGTVNKTLDIIRDAASKGVQMLALPELWIPGYPKWIWSLPALEWAGHWEKYIANSLKVDSPQMMRIRMCCQQNQIWVNVGFAERDGYSLYMSTCWITSTASAGAIASHRRKIMPTGVERVMFGQSSGDSLDNVIDSPFGRLGSLMCWEHAQPLLRYHTATQGEEIHVASWPYLFPESAEELHTGMTNVGCLTLSRAMAIEAGTFVLVATCVMSKSGALLLGLKPEASEKRTFQIPGGGASRVFGPDGRVIAGGDMPDDMEGLVIADIDVQEVVTAKTLMDSIGHYSRPDLLTLSVNTTRHPVAVQRSTDHKLAASIISRYPTLDIDTAQQREEVGLDAASGPQESNGGSEVMV
nr:uncharacterized protein I203_07884 [Kwoniella mangroviensis CBS 8507]OCF63148.1 hypothetical protein I203_07884 [Kwoniella mangroviensis CBS 8507]